MVGIILIMALGAIPVDQLLEKEVTTNFSSINENRIEIQFGGPIITWVTVECNIPAEIHYLYPNGTWVGMENVLLASTFAIKARFNYNGEHSSAIVEIISERPFTAHITYTYFDTVRMNYFERLLYTIGVN
jgi:hypothetical protein